MNAVQWTQDENEALDFKDRPVALAIARELGLQNIQVVSVRKGGKPGSGSRTRIDT
jgi:hypothetical protein